MSTSDPQKSAPAFTITQEVGRVTGGEVVGVKIGTQINMYTFGGAGALPAPPRRLRDAVPYKFLDSYTFDDRDLFFGRELLARQLHDVILGHITTALLGKAAIGKTSLIHAGLIPTLARDGDIVAFSVRDYAAPAAGVRDALRKIPNLALALPEQNSLGALVTAFVAQTERRVVIFFDQFERLFSMPLDYQDEFARQIAAARQQDRHNPLHLVFVLRDDLFDTVTDLGKRVGDMNLFGNTQEIPGLDAEGAQRAIAEPLHVEGELDRAVLDDELIVQYILPQLLAISKSGDGRIDPAPLQIVCSYLYDKAQSAAGARRQPAMSADLYTKLGQASGILQSYLSDERQKLGIGDDNEWAAIRSLLGKMAEADALTFYHATDLSRAVAKSEASVKRWLDLLTARRLIESRDDAAYALIGSFMLGEIRRWFPEQYSQDAANKALVRALADWDDQRLLTERRRLRRIQGARATATFAQGDGTVAAQRSRV
jgi:hypothetical protein